MGRCGSTGQRDKLSSNSEYAEVTKHSRKEGQQRNRLVGSGSTAAALSLQYAGQGARASMSHSPGGGDKGLNRNKSVD